MHDGGLEASHMGLLLVLGWLQFAPEQDMTNPPRLQGSSTVKQHRSRIHAPQIRMYHPTWTAFCKSSLLPTFSSQAAHAPRSGRTPGESRTCRCGTSVDRPKQSPIWPGLCEPVDLERHVRRATVMSSKFWCLVTGSYFPMTSFEMMNKLVITKVYMSINYCQRFLSKIDHSQINLRGTNIAHIWNGKLIFPTITG